MTDLIRSHYNYNIGSVIRYYAIWSDLIRLDLMRSKLSNLIRYLNLLFLGRYWYLYEHRKIGLSYLCKKLTCNYKIHYFFCPQANLEYYKNVMRLYSQILNDRFLDGLRPRWKMFADLGKDFQWSSTYVSYRIFLRLINEVSFSRKISKINTVTMVSKQHYTRRPI